MNPSVANLMLTFLASLMNSISKLSRAFRASLSDGCAITWSFSLTHSLCHLMCLVIFFDRNNCFIWGVRGMYRSCLWATSVITFSSSSFITSMNLDLAHLVTSSLSCALYRKTCSYLCTHQSSHTLYPEQRAFFYWYISFSILWFIWRTSLIRFKSSL
jgi:hypothetical protein